MAVASHDALWRLIEPRVKRILDFAELAVPSDKFERFRTLVLDEFGHKGLRRDLSALSGVGQGMDGCGSGRNDAGKEGGVP